MTKNVAINNQVLIRKAEIKDAERIAILADQLGYIVTSQQAQERIDKIQNNYSHVLYVATLDGLNHGKVIGWIHAYIEDTIVTETAIFVVSLIVDQDYRYRGIGHLLIKQIENWAAKSDIKDILIGSNIKRKEAHLFYEKIGYTNIKQSLTFYKSLAS